MHELVAVLFFYSARSDPKPMSLNLWLAIPMLKVTIPAGILEVNLNILALFLDDIIGGLEKSIELLCLICLHLHIELEFPLRFVRIQIVNVAGIEWR